MAGERRCPVCGKTFLAVRVHLQQKHGISGEDLLLARVMGVPIAVFYGQDQPSAPPPEPEPLEVAFARQLRELTDGVDDIVGQRGAADDRIPDRDLTRYDDAFASAASHCTHDAAFDLVYGRQYHCSDCNRTFGFDEIRRARGW